MPSQYTGSIKRSVASGVDWSSGSGIYIGKVISHLDSKFMGGLEVEIQTKTQSGNAPKEPGRNMPVYYLPPFYTTTPYEGSKPNLGDQFSQKSAGIWFVPPDIGSKVLVVIVEAGFGYWIGCVPEDSNNFMLPGYAATTYNTEDSAQKLPVAEVNKKLNPQNRDATKVQKPVATDIKTSLEEQGLLADETRGITSSSARRELPSTVFGISTPGPYDRRPNAPKTGYGVQNQAEIFHNRLGGSSFVMDDGDASLLRKGDPAEKPPEYANKASGETDGDVTKPHNELIRLKTRTGHQILLHNTEDLIYIGNSRGTSWIELSSNGKIDIYAEDSISVHSKNDINFKADRDINFEAGRDYNVKANNNITGEAVKNHQLVVGENNQITTGGYLHVNTEKEIDLKSNSSPINVLAKKSINLESVSESTNILSKKNNTFTATDGDTSIKSGGYYLGATGKTYHMNDSGAQPREAPSAAAATEASPLITWSLPGDENVIMRRVPQHEPWLHHENLNPGFYTPAETDIKKPNPQGEGIDPNPPSTAEYIMTPDTFRKGT